MTIEETANDSLELLPYGDVALFKCWNAVIVFVIGGVLTGVASAFDTSDSPRLRSAVRFSLLNSLFSL